MIYNATIVPSSTPLNQKWPQLPQRYLKVARASGLLHKSLFRVSFWVWKRTAQVGRWLDLEVRPCIDTMILGASIKNVRREGVGVGPNVYAVRKVAWILWISPKYVQGEGWGVCASWKPPYIICLIIWQEKAEKREWGKVDPKDLHKISYLPPHLRDVMKYRFNYCNALVELSDGAPPSLCVVHLSFVIDFSHG